MEKSLESGRHSSFCGNIEGRGRSLQPELSHIKLNTLWLNPISGTRRPGVHFFLPLFALNLKCYAETGMATVSRKSLISRSFVKSPWHFALSRFSHPQPEHTLYHLSHILRTPTHFYVLSPVLGLNLTIMYYCANPEVVCR